MAISASVVVPGEASDNPPIVMVHGAANSAPVWKFWQRELAALGWPSYAVNLRGHGPDDASDLSETGMGDYAEEVRRVMDEIGRPVAVMGWSMGGLVAMMAAVSGKASACVTLAPSTPSRTEDKSVELRTGEFGPEEYGITGLDPEDQPAMPDLDLEERKIAIASLGRESRRARDERRKGVVIEAMPCPLLIVTGDRDRQWPSEVYDDLWLKFDRFALEDASHWGLVLNRRAIAQAVPRVTEWLSNVASS